VLGIVKDLGFIVGNVRFDQRTKEVTASTYLLHVFMRSLQSNDILS